MSWSRPAGRCSAVLALLALTASPPASGAGPAAAAPSVETVVLDDFKKIFEADQGKVRLLLILSPTCGKCLHGATVVGDQVLAAINSPDLKVYVVWLPVLDADTEEKAAESASKIVDARARHLWNPDLSLSVEASRSLRISAQLEQAWDVFLVFGPDVRWTEPHMPAPSAWMHQLNDKDPRLLTPEGLTRIVRALLPEPGAGGSARPAPAKRNGQ
jgi:hypothetical protein